MVKEDDLTNLIQSLSKSEKRYFKLYVDKNTKGESNHYIKLFDLIEKAGTAEKKAIQTLYVDNDFMRSQFRVYKHLLYKMILKSLTAFHSEKSVDDQIQEAIRQAKVLYDKALYSQAGKVIKKAKYIACKYEKDTILLEIIRWQKKIMISSSIYGNASEKDIIQLSKEEKISVHKVGNVNQYWEQYVLMFQLYLINGKVRNQEEIKKYNRIIDIPILKNEELPSSFQSKKYFYAIYFLYYEVVNNMKEAYISCKKFLDLMEALPHQLEEEATQYIATLHNLLFCMKKLKKYEELINTIPKLRSMLKKFPEYENTHWNILIYTHNIEFSIYLDTGQFQKAEKILTEIEALLQSQKNSRLSFELSFNLNKALFYFGNNDYHKAISCINFILNKKKADVLEDHYSFAKIFSLILHFERGNIELLPYLIRSVYRYLLRKNKLYIIESVFLEFIRTKLFLINNKKDFIEAFQSLREKLIIVFENPLETIFLEFFDIISWLESKIEGRPFGEILREKSGYTLEEENG